MGRWVYLERGNISWEWKFAFATQCSNFGVLIKAMCPEYVRLRGPDGNGVRVFIECAKEELIERLKAGIIELKLIYDKCPICGNNDCLQCTIEMFKDFLEAVKKCQENEIYAEFYVEYW